MTRLVAPPLGSVATWWETPLAVVLLVLGLAAVGPELRALPLVYLAAVTPYLCRVDFEVRRLPNRIVLPGYAAAAGGILGQALVAGWPSTAVPLAAGAVYFAFLLVPALLGGMGMGDVKLAGVLGVSAGLIGATTAVISPLAAFLLGGVAAIVAIARGSGASIPFGPFLLAGFWIAVALT